jgi:hypothetical protein
MHSLKKEPEYLKREKDTLNMYDSVFMPCKDSINASSSTTR